MTGLFNFFKKDKRGYSENERREMLKEQDYSCVRCGGRINIRTAEADHKYPHSAGGSTDRCNGQMLCHDCHVKKSNSERGVYYGHQKKSWWNFSRNEKPDKYEKKSRWNFSRNEKPDKYEKKSRWWKPDKYEKKTWGNSFRNNYFEQQKKSNTFDYFKPQKKSKTYDYFKPQKKSKTYDYFKPQKKSNTYDYFKPQKKSNNVDPFGSDFFGTGKPKRRRKKYF